MKINDSMHGACMGVLNLLTMVHRRRKILKVGGAEYPIAREKFTTTPTLCQTTPIFA